MRHACRQARHGHANADVVHREAHRCRTPRPNSLLVTITPQAHAHGLPTGWPHLSATHHMCASQRLVLRCLVTPLNLLLWRERAGGGTQAAHAHASTKGHSKNDVSNTVQTSHSEAAP